MFTKNFYSFVKLQVIINTIDMIIFIIFGTMLTSHQIVLFIMLTVLFNTVYFLIGHLLMDLERNKKIDNTIDELYKGNQVLKHLVEFIENGKAKDVDHH
jgi:ABC-type bacteriocin/lantibiotic exporter with double-glycine peptidase domain